MLQVKKIKSIKAYKNLTIAKSRREYFLIEKTKENSNSVILSDGTILLVRKPKKTVFV